MKFIVLFIVSLAIFLPLSAFAICTTNTPNNVNQVLWIHVRDTDGNPLNSSSRYFILPAYSTMKGGGVRLADLGDQQQNTCPTAVVQSKTVTDNGIGVYFMPKYSIKDIVLNSPLNIKFYLDYVTPCNDLLVWKVDNLGNPVLLHNHTISTGGKTGNPLVVGSWLRIQHGTNMHYKLVFCPVDECYNIGIVEQSGYHRLVLSENSMLFKFKLHAPIGKAEAC